MRQSRRVDGGSNERRPRLGRGREREMRWATFDCYGTLIDWNGGLRRELARVFGEEQADGRLERYHEVEPSLQTGGDRTYQEVMALAMRELGAPADEEGALARGLPSWEPC